jgi:alginate O-acetyltransferase complex protein AlgI
MLLNSPFFLFLVLPVLIGVFAVAPSALRFHLLLSFSILGYLWAGPAWGVVVLGLAGLNFLIALRLATLSGRSRTYVLAAAVVGNVAVMIISKELVQGVDLLQWTVSTLHLGDRLAEQLSVLEGGGAVGISFIVFVILSYLFDVYYETIPAEKRLGRYLFHIFFFPKVLSGPITRYADTVVQIDRVRVNLREGVARFISGLGKKVLLATPLGSVTDAIFSLDPANLTAATAWMGIISYALQIYYDFAGYTDMALGLAMFFGVRLPENFNYPYCATSITEFWRRWHITLSGWFRDYVFLPLEYSRQRNSMLRWPQTLNVLIVFALTGLWHGLSLGFLAWGLLHGSCIGLELWVGKGYRRIPVAIQRGYALMAILAGWVLFRSTSLQQAGCFLRALVGGQESGMSALASPYLSPTFALIVLAGIMLAFPIDYFGYVRRWHVVPIESTLVRCAPVLKVAALIAVLVLSLMGTAAATYRGFIYFQF